MKAISFLGTTRYTDTTYIYRGLDCHTCFFAEALPHFFPELSQVLVLVTPTVRQHPNLAELQARLGPLLTPVPIPEGHSESALWEILDTLTVQIEAGDRVLFDITNSFRSLPFLVFLAAAYLRSARQVQVEAVIYGAFEARDAANRSPVFDLTPFVSLLDWITATNRFLEVGDGNPLAALLENEMPPGVLMGDDLEARQMGINLRMAASAIQHISLALRTTRPIETLEAAQALVDTMARTRSRVVQEARPFQVLVDQVTARYGQFALKDPLCAQAWQQNLRHQLTMVRWYLERGQTVQAATLAREWVVSVLALRFGEAILSREGRSAVEDALNRAAERHKDSPRHLPVGRCDRQYQALPNEPEITSLWSKLTQIRNDIAHVGMRENALPAARLKSKVERLFTELENLAALIP